MFKVVFQQAERKAQPGQDSSPPEDCWRVAARRPEFEEIQEGFDYIEFLLDKS